VVLEPRFKSVTAVYSYLKLVSTVHITIAYFCKVLFNFIVVCPSQSSELCFQEIPSPPAYISCISSLNYCLACQYFHNLFFERSINYDTFLYAVLVYIVYLMSRYFS
jgi:hypothetical protein